MPTTTLLVLSGIGVPEWSARGITQTLTPIAQQGALRRTANGGMIDLGLSQFRKYASTISATDQAPPAFEGLWRGMELVVDCIEELSYSGMTGAPAREVVSSRTEDGFVIYRPRLYMVVIDWNQAFQEWQAGRTWSLSLEET